MDIKQCARCSKLYDFRGNRNCPLCVRELDEVFLKVRNYIYSNPKAGVEEVCDACEADEDDVYQWLREGRLILSADSAALLTCQACRTPIQSGRYCEACAHAVRGQLEGTAQLLGSQVTAAQPKPSADSKERGAHRVHLDIRRS